MKPDSQPPNLWSHSPTAPFAPPSAPARWDRTGQAPGRAYEDGVGVGAIGQDAPDAARFQQPHVGLRGAGVGGFRDAIAHHVAIADGPGLAGSGSDHVMVGARHGERADACTGWASKIGAKVLHESVDVHTPPDAAPA